MHKFVYCTTLGGARLLVPYAIFICLEKLLIYHNLLINSHSHSYYKFQVEKGAVIN